MSVSYPMVVTWTPACERFFTEARIYLRHVMQIEGVWAVGQKVTLTHQVIAEPHATMPVRGFYSSGCHSYCASWMPANVRVGRFCSIAPGVSLMGTQHPLGRFTSSPVTYNERFVRIAREDFGRDYRVKPFRAELPPPVIGHDVWIGEHASIKGGVTIGHGSVVAAHSVVTHDVPPYAVVGGVPAKVIKMRFPERVVERLLRVQWWQYNFVDLPTDCSTDIGRFLDVVEDNAASGKIRPYLPKQYDIGAELHRLTVTDPQEVS